MINAGEAPEFRPTPKTMLRPAKGQAKAGPAVQRLGSRTALPVNIPTVHALVDVAGRSS